MQLEGNWLTLLLTGQIPMTHRANKWEILRYYKDVVDKYVASGQVRYFPHSTYDLDQAPEIAVAADNEDNNDGVTIHSFVSASVVNGDAEDCPSSAGRRHHRVRVKVMMVDAVQGEVQIPATTPPRFAVKDTSLIKVVTPNELHSMHQTQHDVGSNETLSGYYGWKDVG
jgi:hypothetical protein